jgi:hypothetical protein
MINELTVELAEALQEIRDSQLLHGPTIRHDKALKVLSSALSSYKDALSVATPAQTYLAQNPPHTREARLQRDLEAHCRDVQREVSRASQGWREEDFEGGK